jgi:hypothetical protein
LEPLILTRATEHCPGSSRTGPLDYSSSSVSCLSIGGVQHLTDESLLGALGGSSTLMYQGYVPDRNKTYPTLLLAIAPGYFSSVNAPLYMCDLQICYPLLLYTIDCFVGSLRNLERLKVRIHASKLFLKSTTHSERLNYLVFGT